MVALAVGMLAGVGRPQFAQGLLETLMPVLPASHCGVFALDAAAEVSAVSYASAYGDQAAITSAIYIGRALFRRDANVQWLAARKTATRSQTWLLHQQADEIADAEYRQACFGDTGIRERLALLLLTADDRRFIVNLYRNLSLPVYTAADRTLLSTVAPLIEATLMAHLRVTEGTLSDDVPPVTTELLKPLSGRERQVIAQVVAGRTTKEVAALLGLSANTVLTYRYRAFRTLGIRTQRELLAMVGSGRAVMR